MRIAFVERPNKGCDLKLFNALGATVGGSADLIGVIGIKNAELIRSLQSAGKPFLYFDKGYNRSWSPKHPEWWRVSINAYHPTEYLHRLAFPCDRAKEQDWRLKPWRAKGDHILFAGSSAKYHAFHGLCEPNGYAAHVINRLKAFTQRKIIYRPKPSWGQAEPVEGAVFVNQARYHISSDLAGAHALVTHGSNAAFDALIEAVPAIILGQGVTASISSRHLEEIEQPLLASEAYQKQLLANIAYCQWSLTEISKGQMWPAIEAMLKCI